MLRWGKGLAMVAFVLSGCSHHNDGHPAAQPATPEQSAANGRSSVRVANLRCEYRVNPLGIDTVEPRLYWTLEAASTARGVAQTAYRVIATTSREKLDRDQGDLWDSGKVTSDETTHVACAGRHPLDCSANCMWSTQGEALRGTGGESGTEPSVLLKRTLRQPWIQRKRGESVVQRSRKPLVSKRLCL